MPIMQVGMRAILPKTQMKARFDLVLSELEKEIKGPINEEVKNIFNEIVANWSVKPSFAGMKIVEPDKVGIKVYAKGPGKQRFDWVWMGTRPHTIEAKGDKPLRFRHSSGWVPKTTAGDPPTYGQASSDTGPWVAKWQVEHPGIEARRFDLYVKGKYQQRFRQRLNNALKRGVRIGSRA